MKPIFGSLFWREREILESVSNLSKGEAITIKEARLGLGSHIEWQFLRRKGLECETCVTQLWC